MNLKFLVCSELIQKHENSIEGFGGTCGIYLGFSETRKDRYVVFPVVKFPTLHKLTHSAEGSTIRY